MKIFEAPYDLRYQINTFYQQQGYHGQWSEKERAFIAMNNGDVIGSVKVECVNQVSILRGMYISPEYQGQKLGTELIKHIEPLLNKTVSYCLPFSHLARFYHQIGFSKAELSMLPAFLTERFCCYEKQGYKIIPMKREIVNSAR